MLVSTSTVLAAFAALATLTQPATAQQHRLRWRHAGPGDSRRWLVTCNMSPVGPARIGTTFGLAHDYAKYCSVDWTVVKDTAAPIFTGGTVAPGITFPKYCLDATLYPGNGILPHLWDCYDGLYQQQWVYHSATGHVELGCSGLCLDVKDGYNGDGGYDAVQLWDCIPGNSNQEWDYVVV